MLILNCAVQKVWRLLGPIGQINCQLHFISSEREWIPFYFGLALIMLSKSSKASKVLCNRPKQTTFNSGQIRCRNHLKTVNFSLRFVNGSCDFATKPKFNFLMRNQAHDLRCNSRMVYHLSYTITLLSHLFALLQHSVASNLQASAFDETTSKLESRFLKARLATICDDKRRSVVECYRLNKSASLLCSQQVRDFAACVGSARVVSCLSFLFNQCRPLIDVCISRPKVQLVDWPSQGVNMCVDHRDRSSLYTTISVVLTSFRDQSPYTSTDFTDYFSCYFYTMPQATSSSFIWLFTRRNVFLYLWSIKYWIYCKAWTTYP